MSEKKVEVRIGAKDETKGVLASIREHVASWASDLRTKFVEAFAIEHVLEKAGEYIKDFFVESIQKASEAEGAWTQLRNTLGNFGLSLGQVQPELEEHIRALQKVANIRTDDAVAAFNQLLQTSGNYEGSLKNLGLVLDLMTAKHLSLETATDLVGRVLAGNTTMLTRYGIVVKQGGDAIAEMTQRFGGAAQTDLTTFAGAVQHGKNAFEDLEEAIGSVLIQDPVLKRTLLGVAEAFEHAASWVEEHHSGLTKLVTAVIEYVRLMLTAWHDWGVGVYDVFYGLAAYIDHWIVDVIGGLLAAVNSIPHAINDLIGAANHLPGVHIAVRMPTLDATVAQFRSASQQMAADGVAHFKDAGHQVVDFAQTFIDAIRTVNAAGGRETGAAGGRHGGEGGGGGGGGSDADAQKQAEDDAKQRAALDKGLKDKYNAEHLGDTQLTRAKPELGTVDVNSTVAAMHGISAAVQDVPTNVFSLALTQGLKDVRIQLQGATSDTQTFGDALTSVVQQPVEQFASAASKAFEAWTTHSGSAGKAFKGAMQSALQGVAVKEGKFYEAKAIAALGEVIFTGNPQAAAAAVEFGAASAAFFALAGAMGGGGGAGGGGGGGGGGGRGPSGSAASNPAAGVQGAQGVVQVVLKGRKTLIDHRNPDDLDALQQAILQLAGNRQVQFVFED